MVDLPWEQFPFRRGFYILVLCVCGKGGVVHFTGHLLIWIMHIRMNGYYVYGCATGVS